MAIIANWKFNWNRNDSSWWWMNLSSLWTLQNSKWFNGNINCNNQIPSAAYSSLFNTIWTTISNIMWITNNNPSQTNKYCWLLKPIVWQDAIIYWYVANTYETFWDRIWRFTIKNIWSNTGLHQVWFSYNWAQTKTYFDWVLISTNTNSSSAIPTWWRFYLWGSNLWDAIASADYDEIIFDNITQPDSFFKNNYLLYKWYF